MPDTPETGGGGTLRVRNIRADRQFSKEMHVQRLSVNTGEAKDAGSDMMAEVNESVGEQTDTLATRLEKIETISQKQLDVLKSLSSEQKRDPERIATAIQQALAKDLASVGQASTKKLDSDLTESISTLRAAIVALTASTASNAVPDEGGGGGGSDHSTGEAAARARLFATAQDFGDVFAKHSELMRKLNVASARGETAFERLFSKGVFETLRGNMINLANKFQSMGEDMVRFSNITNVATSKFNSAVEVGTTGIGGFTRSILDFFPAIVRGGDNIKDSMALIRRSVENDLANPLGIVGGDLNEVSKGFRQARLGLRDQGVNAFDRLSFQASNEAMLQLLDLERRNSATANVNNPITMRNMANSLSMAQLIATNTGRTADEVIKMNQDRERQLRDLSAAGGLSREQQINFSRAQAFFKGRGMGQFADMVQDVGMSGGSESLYFSKNSDKAADLSIMNKLGEFRELMSVINRGGSMDDVSFANALSGVAQRFGNNAHQGVAGAAMLSEFGSGLAGESGRGGTMKADESSTEMRWITGIKDVLSNTLPLSELKFLTAIGANTVALWVNTAAHGGAIMGVLGGVTRGLAGFTKTAAKIGGIGAGLAAIGGKMALGKTALTGGAKLAMGAGKGLGKSLLKKLPLFGLLAGLGFAGSRAFSGDFTGAGMELASGAASMVPGVGTAASMGIDAALLARDMSGSGEQADISSVGPSNSGNVTKNRGIRNDTQRLILDTNRLLERLISLSGDQLDVQEDIKRNTAGTSVQTPAGFWDWAFGKEDKPIASHSE